MHTRGVRPRAPRVGPTAQRGTDSLADDFDDYLADHRGADVDHASEAADNHDCAEKDDVDLVPVEFVHVVHVHTALAHADHAVGDFVHLHTRRVDDLVDRRDDTDDQVSGRWAGFAVLHSGNDTSAPRSPERVAASCRRFGMLRLRGAAVLAVSSLIAAIGAPGAHAVSAPLLSHRPVIRIAANESQNWSGYNQGSLARGGVRFHEIAGDWTVPMPNQHKAGEAEYSSDWIGIGGGCVNAACTVGDNTLIQTGTEQDIASNGRRTYSAWWELIPQPETMIAMTVHVGDRMHAEISEAVAGSNVWTIVLTDRTTGKTFKKTTAYPSSHLTAEWIQERPTLIGTSGTSLAPLPVLTNPVFDFAKVNGALAGLKVAQEILMTDASAKVIARPSAPDHSADGFNACTYTSICIASTGS